MAQNVRFVSTETFLTLAPPKTNVFGNKEKRHIFSIILILQSFMKPLFIISSKQSNGYAEVVQLLFLLSTIGNNGSDLCL